MPLLIVCGTPLAAEEETARIAVDPAHMVLEGANARYSLLVEGHAGNGTVSDQTRNATYESLTPEFCSVDADGIVIGAADGNGKVRVTLGELTAEIDVEVRDQRSARRFNFERDVVPILSRHGCNSSGCHGKAEGQNGFKLSVFGFDPPADYAALLHEGRGRRVSLVRPEQSLLLTKVDGSVPHGGGVRIPRDAEAHRVLTEWVLAGAPLGSPDDPRVTAIELSPRARRMTLGGQQQLRIVATYSDGRRLDITPLAQFQTNSESLARVDEHGLVTAGETPGDVAVMAAFMGHVDVFRVLIPRPDASNRVPSPPPHNEIDRLVDAKLARLNISASELCTDADFLRRVFLDVIGTLPTADESRQFLADSSPDKREQLVNALLQRSEYADYWALRWADLLRVDRQTLGYRAAHDYYRWIRDSFAENKPYDQFVRELLTAEGLLADAPAGYLYKVVPEPGKRASAVSQVFLGVRIECAQCHHHPFDRWSQTDYAGMAALFVQPAFKSTSRGELLFSNGVAAVSKHQRTGESVSAHPLGEARPEKTSTADARTQLADWMTSPENAWFARNLVNRMAAHFFGRGLVEPVDDTRLTNPPSNPELLDGLAARFVELEWNVHALIREMTASRTYQLSCTPNESNSADEQNYSRALLKPLQAEVLLDAICQVTDVPEKFDGMPHGVRAVELWDSHVPHYFLKIHGRPMRATACDCERTSEPTVSQVLHVMNSPEIQSKLSHAGGRVARWSAKLSDDGELVDEVYLTCYSRYPSESEREASVGYLSSHRDHRREAIEDVVWTLLNGTEFLFNH